MRVKVKGLQALRRIRKDFEAPEKVLRKASEVGAESMLNLIAQCFRTGTDPYGSPWEAPNNLQITGGIRRYTKKETTSGGWKCISTDQKAIWHHAPRPRDEWSGKALPTRLQVPTTSRGWPRKWKLNVVRGMQDSVDAQLRR